MRKLFGRVCAVATAVVMMADCSQNMHSSRIFPALQFDIDTFTAYSVADIINGKPAPCTLVFNYFSNIIFISIQQAVSSPSNL